ncbi:MAG: hypothetical protein COB30_016155 [Ectothiorhodospiraceae bacterium]|nr:hypothetical protein [Ectothiorhodospiraceae bacterium]
MMNVDKAEWYRNRILWKASQHKLFEDNESCYEGSQLSEIQKNKVFDIDPDLDVVLLFWHSQDKWTALGTEMLCSVYEDSLITVELDKIHKGVVLDQLESQSGQDAKFESEFICLSNLNEKIWAPSGSNLFALINILRMFPLAEKKIA